GDVLFLLDGVAERDAVHANAGGLHHLDLAARRGVELRAEPRQARQDLRRWIGLHGVEDVGRRQQLAHAPVVVLDHIEVDHQARRLGLLLSEITENTLGHRWAVPRLKADRFGGTSNGTDGANRQRASADTRRREEPLERQDHQYRLLGLEQANDTIAGDTPRAVSNHVRSSLPDPAFAGTAKKD